ncbi:MAG TPA: site-specific integrase [Chloroflexota bacterium]|nr:site-specific integrase [Chloroflexota bacterium]
MPRRSTRPPPEQLALPFTEPGLARSPENRSVPASSSGDLAMGEARPRQGNHGAGPVPGTERPSEPTPVQGPLRFSQIVPTYLEFCAAIDRAPHTMRTIELDLGLLVRFLEDRPIPVVGLDDLRHFAAWLRQERHNDARSLRRKIASVKAFFAYLKRQGLREDDPSEALIYPSAEPHLPEFLERDEAQRLIDAAERLLWRALIILLLDTGLKRDEVLALHPADVFLDTDEPEHSYLVVRAANQARRIRARTLPLGPQARAVLHQYLPNAIGDRLFPISVRAVNLIVETTGERAGLRKRGPICPQMLRDTFAVQEVRRRLAIEAEHRKAGLSAGALTVLMERHDQEVCELLGLTAGGPNDPIARYRILAAAGRI